MLSSTLVKALPRCSGKGAAVLPALSQVTMSSHAHPERESFPIKNVTVIGAGLMGAGITQISAQASFKVTVVDQTDDILKKSLKGLEKSLKRVAKKGFPDDQKGEEAFVHDTMGNIAIQTDVSKAVEKADLVIEAIVENLDVKRKLFAQIEKAAPKSAILVTNTSSLCLADIALNLSNKKQFGGMHFFNPVPVMKLLEVVRMTETSKETFDKLVQFGHYVGKTTVDCKDVPGFIVNRLLVPYMMEALRMFERGDASMKDIDIGMKLGAGYPMGPFELADYVGLDTTKFIIDGWHSKFPNEPLFNPSPLLNKLVSEKKFGRKTGEGFYNYQQH